MPTPVTLPTPSIIESHHSISLGGGVYSPPIPSGWASGMLVQAVTANIRFTLSNGVAPTTTTGFLLTASDPPVYIPLGTHFTPQFIAETSGAVLEYQFIG